MITKKSVFIFILPFLISYKSIGQWEAVHSPSMGTLPRLTCLDFINCIDGIAASYHNWMDYNSHILQTSNGGSDWDTILALSDSALYEDIVYPTNNRIIAVGSGSNGGIIRASQDGGTSWTTTNFPLSIFGISMPSPLIGYSCGADGNLYKTMNGGITWDSIVSPTTDSLYEVEFINIDTGFVASFASPCQIYRTIDGGTSWSSVLSNGSQFFLSAPSTNVIYALSKIAFDTMLMYKTQNLGNTWSVDTFFSNQFMWAIDFSNDSTGYVTGTNFVYKTMDWGKTWISQNVTSGVSSSFSSPLYDIKFINDSSGFLVGKNQFYRTEGSCYISGFEKNESVLNQVNIYPNPFTHDLTFDIRTSQTETGIIQIISVTGQELYNGTFTSNTPFIVQEEFDKGLYFVQIKVEKQVKVVKVVKQ